jgi:hypothetical protein
MVVKDLGERNASRRGYLRFGNARTSLGYKLWISSMAAHDGPNVTNRFTNDKLL